MSMHAIRVSAYGGGVVEAVDNVRTGEQLA